MLNDSNYERLDDIIIMLGHESIKSCNHLESESIKIESLKPETFLHNFSTTLVQNGVPIEWVFKQLDHKSYAVNDLVKIKPNPTLIE